jgi:8-oxo-dGTP pyrophosphatase MutT (NUDIX family)
MKPGKDCIGIGVGALIFHPWDGKLLMLKRGLSCPYDIGKWEFPGGKVEKGDTLVDTVLREVREEVGLVVKTVMGFPVTELILGDQHWLGFSFLCLAETVDAKIQEPSKCMELQWLTFEEIQVLQAAGELSIWAVRDIEKLQTSGQWGRWLQQRAIDK